MVCYKTNLFLHHVCVPVMLFSAWSCFCVCFYDPPYQSQSSGNKEELSKSLHRVPCVEFYRTLHGLLKKWEKNVL